jgi:predicted small lipoprotein YifL
MKKKISLLLVLLMVLFAFTGCSSKPAQAPAPAPAPAPAKDDAVKTGIAVISSIAKSTDATAEKEGLAQIDSTVVAVTVDKDGKIVKCAIDSAQTKINFTKEGKLTTDLKTVFKSKQELGTAYGMSKASKIGKEWNEEANALAAYVIGKTVAEVKGIAVNADGVPTVADLTGKVTIKIGGYVDAIEKAVANAKDLGAKKADKLGLGVETTIAKSKDASVKDGAPVAGLAQAYSYYTATTFGADGKITSCAIEASQSNVNFSGEGKITSDLKAPLKSKLELGFDYGMKKASKIGKEWFEQADAFSKYVVGKTVADVKGIAVTDGKATAADLTASVTVGIGEFQSTIEKAAAIAK